MKFGFHHKFENCLRSFVLIVYFFCEQGLRWLTCQVEAAYNRRVTNKELSLDNHQVRYKFLVILGTTYFSLSSKLSM